MINFYLIKSKGERYFKESKRSFYCTVPTGIDLSIVEEMSTREETLNSIFSINNKQNMVCFSDDVILTSGWYQIIVKNLFGYRALGFSMENPITGKVSNYGYDIVNDDGDIKTMARTAWLEDIHYEPDFSRCASFTGCFFSLSSKCFDLVPNVPLEGQNRLGELLYHVSLSRAGGSVLVSPHALGHYSVSTKGHTGDIINSQSFQDEQFIWHDAIKKFNLHSSVSRTLGSSFSKPPPFFTDGLVVWGAGSIASKVIIEYSLDVSYFISGLIEEDGKDFMDRKVIFYQSLGYKNISNILITIENLEHSVLAIIKDNLNVKNIYYIQVLDLDDERCYSIEKF